MKQVDRTRPGGGMTSRASGGPSYPIFYSKIPVLGSPAIIVELLEDTPSRWLLEELLESYLFAVQMGYRFAVTGATNPLVYAAVRRAGIPVFMERGYSLNRPGCILLDLWSPKRLEPEEASSASYIIVGGIMGDHPPKGRTYLLSSQVYTACAKRNLGPEQLSVDGAVKTAILVAEGYRLDEIEFEEGVEVEVESPVKGVSAKVELPYAYPKVGDRILVSQMLLSLLSKGIIYEEEYLA
ncbi:conserved hypothetical protein [Aeropyrum pernix]|uniref:Uncharacterized protein n=1 Tax=Aeropyrum pernix TaxID=56636 RepID=A0A401H901_AERPX|nr:conserved hypothetical protein [Aeropyrum pernix]